MECIDFERRYKQAALDICHESQQRCRCVKCSAFEVEEIFQIETELVIHLKDTLVVELWLYPMLVAQHALWFSTSQGSEVISNSFCYYIDLAIFIDYFNSSFICSHSHLCTTKLYFIVFLLLFLYDLLLEIMILIEHCLFYEK